MAVLAVDDHHDRRTDSIAVLSFVKPRLGAASALAALAANNMQNNLTSSNIVG